MGRKPSFVSQYLSSHAESSNKPPVMKFAQAARLADKNSRTIAKISQLMEYIHKPGSAIGDPKRVIEQYIEKLKRRVNRRLQTLAKWSDSSSDERQSEFKNQKSFFYARPIPFGQKQIQSQPVPTSTTLTASVVPPASTSTVPITVSKPNDQMKVEDINAQPIKIKEEAKQVEVTTSAEEVKDTTTDETKELEPTQESQETQESKEDNSTDNMEIEETNKEE